ncbi:GNAT family N-acetyltransferase [Aliivibrio sifiae]|uniref:Acetyltransferase n=1 Tax=Aliivibrio sifiae TaxID=566293 RepID=A0A2S7X816_9GAMM|nr:GNAT family N-acetyltransferase [Aliivibrio sifiae]PQJ87489.1 GNAT family N-acetyltransferase [Aliivibrio sifiae]GLR77149.1 acetyltransferase [Aliivibrio sifiae]
MELVVPSLELESEFLAFFEDYIANDISNIESYLLGKEDFSSYIQSLTDESNGINLREGFVPCSHFWLINDNQSILGVVRIRHNISNEFLALEAGHIGYDIAPSFRRNGYGKSILKLALTKAKKLVLNRVLLTADEDNIASRKIIESNGGKFGNIVMGKVFPNPLARYWVRC